MEMQPNLPMKSFAILAVLLALPIAADAAESGSLCIPRMPPPLPRCKECCLIPVGAIAPGSTLAIRVDRREPVIVSPDAGALIDGLALGRKHLLRIGYAGESRSITSFRFDFESEGVADLCVWYYQIYGTFSLRHRRDCACR